VRRLFLLLLCIAATPSFACDVEKLVFDRPRAFSDERVEAIVTGFCPSAAVPFRPIVRLDGTAVTIDLTAGGEGIIARTPWGERVRLPRLFPGQYSVVVRIAGQEAARKMLVVHDRPFRVTPHYGYAFQEILIEGVPVDAVCPLENCGLLGVFFGDVAAVVEDIGDQRIVAKPPPGNGRVDVRVELRSGATFTFPGGFSYDLTDEETDFDRVLVPVNFAGPGAHGAQWETDVRLRNDGPVGVDVVPNLVPGPPPTLSVDTLVRPGVRVPFVQGWGDGGVILFATPGLEKQLTYVSHIVDRSRSTTDLGAEMPLVRAEDTANTIRLLHVPVEQRYRARLRIYDYDLANGRPVTVVIHDPEGGMLSFRQLTLTGYNAWLPLPSFSEHPAFAALDLDQLPELRGHDRVDITIASRTAEGRIWAFVSVANNETQAVTLYTPQHRTRAQ
jgi:hypothetical protein